MTDTETNIINESTDMTEQQGMPGAEGEAVKAPKSASLPPFLSKILNAIGRWWTTYIHDRGYLLIGALLAMIIMYGLDIVMQIPPFGDGSVMVLDLNAQYVYFFEALRRAIYGQASFLYSFSRSMGGEFMGIYAYYLASPFSYLVALFPEGAMQEALTTIFILKTGFLAYTFGWYIHKTEKVKNRVAVIVFSLLYAFTSYAVVMQHNTMWIDALIWLPIVTYGIEQLVKYGKFKVFVIFLALTIMSNFYIGYMVCIYVALYFFTYYIGHSDKSGNPYGEKVHFLRSLFRIGLWSAIAVAISAVIILTAYYSLQFGKTTFSSPDWKPSFRFDFYELLAKFFPGTYDTVRPAGLPFVYCGVLSLLLVPVFFISSKFTNREKIGYALICVILVMSFTISSADIFWHGFQKPNWLNYRYSFMLDFLLLVMAYKAFTALEEMSLKFFVLIGCGLTGIVFWLQTMEFDEDNFSDVHTVIFSLICIGLYLIIVPACVHGKFKNLASVFLLVVTCIEVFLNGVCCVTDLDDDVVYTHYSYYNNYNESIREIMNLTMESDPTFYRMEKTTMRKKNDAFVFGMRGIAGSTSTLNQATLDFLDSIGYSAASHWSYYYSGTVLNDSLLGIKYEVSDEAIDNSVYTEAYTDSAGKYTAYLNPYALSIAFGASSDFLDYSADDYPNAVARLNAIYSMLLGSDEILEIYKPVENLVCSHAGLSTSTTSDGYVKYSKSGSGTGSQIVYTFTVPVDTDLVMYIGSDYPKDMTVLHDAMEMDMEDIEGKRIFSLGSITADSPSCVTIQLDESNLYILADCSVIYYVDYDLLEQATAKLKSQELVTDASSTDSKITGTMHIDSDDTFVFTSIAYDAGWRVYIDGKRVETFETADALVGFTADAGDHTVVLKYLPNCFVYGMIITISGIVVFILFCIFWDKINKLKFCRILLTVEPRATEPEEHESLESQDIPPDEENPLEDDSGEIFEAEASSDSALPSDEEICESSEAEQKNPSEPNDTNQSGE